MYKTTKPIRLIELFAGIGIQSMALDRLYANYEHYKVCEIDKYAIQSYNAIHYTNFNPLDIRKLRGQDLEIVNTNEYTYIMTCSFPCTSLSQAGKQEGMKENDNTKSSLLWEVKRLLLEAHNLPQVFIMENVTQIHNKNNIKDFEKWCKFLENLGYTNSWNDLIATDFGIPQKRKRTYMVSILNGSKFELPKPTFEYDKNYFFNLQVFDFLEPKEDIDEKYYLNETQLRRMMQKNKKFTGNADPYCIINKPIASTITTREGRGRACESNFICYTLPINYNPREITNLSEHRIRRLTPLECWRLMGIYDSDFNKVKATNLSDNQLYKQAGNGIVVQVLEEIFGKLITEVLK